MKRGNLKLAIGMTVLAATCALAQSAEAEAESKGACPAQVWGLTAAEVGATTVGVDSYPRERLLRPVTVPGGMIVLELAGAYRGTGGSAAGNEDASAGLSVRRGFGCSVEVGLATGFRFTPFDPIPAVAVSVQVALVPGGLALLAMVQAPIPNRGGTLTYGVMLGLPFRYALGPGLAIVGLDHLLNVFASSFAGGAGTFAVLGLAAPVGLLLQPAEWLAVEVRASPRLGFLLAPPDSGAGTSLGFDAHLQVSWAPSRHLEFTLGGYLRNRPLEVDLSALAAIQVRF